MKKLISIILPVYNEEKNLPLLYAALSKTLNMLPAYEFEIIFINDGSRDNSWNLIKQLAAQDLRISGINFSRNFSQQMALTAGYHAARGDAIITMDTDMQNPPSLIGNMIDAWSAGNKIVYARRIASSDRWLKKITSKMFNAIISSIADIEMPQHIGYFILVDRCVADIINTMPERSRFLRGLIAWTGFKSSYIDFEQPERAHGSTAYSWAQLFGIAFDAIMGFSRLPARLPLYSGLCFMILLALSFIWPDWQLPIIGLGITLQFVVLWLLGEYVSRSYNQLRNRPLYIVAETVGAQSLIEKKGNS